MILNYLTVRYSKVIKVRLLCTRPVVSRHFEGSFDYCKAAFYSFYFTCLSHGPLHHLLSHMVIRVIGVMMMIITMMRTIPMVTVTVMIT